MKKAIFVHKMPRGNFGNADSEYIPATLAQMNYDVTMIALVGGDASFLRNAGVKVIELDGNNAWFTGLADAARSIQPDIVHVFIHAGCGSYPLIMRTNAKSRFILSIRSPILRTGLSRYIVQIKNRLEPIFFDAITAHSVESAWTLISKRHSVNLVPTGADLKAIPAPIDRARHDGPLRMIYIGSLRGLRNIPTMIEAVMIAGKTLPLQLDIIGDGDDKGKITELIRHHQAENWIHLKPVIPRNELFREFSLYDIGLSYVPKALYDPAPPLKTIEYLASGLTVVATNTKGNASLIRHRENGILTDEDPLSFAKGILLAANTPQLRQKFSENARSSVEQFDWHCIIEHYLLPVYDDQI